MAGTLDRPAVGAAMPRVEGHAKVSGEALYAVEHDIEGVAHAALVQSTVAKGEVRAVDADAALALKGVLAVLWHENAPRVASDDDPDLAVLQRSDIAFRGQIVAVVVADSLEVAREAAALVRVDYDAAAHDVELTADHPKLYKPDKVNPAFDTDTERGDVAAGLAAAATTIDATYSTPAQHNNPMEPHGTLALWRDGDLTLYESTQGAPMARDAIAKVLGLDPEQVRVIAPHVGGGSVRRARRSPTRSWPRSPRATSSVRSSSPSRASRCSSSPATGRRPSSACAWAPTPRGA